jgi:hypothetical protein
MSLPVSQVSIHDVLGDRDLVLLIMEHLDVLELLVAQLVSSAWRTAAIEQAGRWNAICCGRTLDPGERGFKEAEALFDKRLKYHDQKEMATCLVRLRAFYRRHADQCVGRLRSIRCFYQDMPASVRERRSDWIEQCTVVVFTKALVVLGPGGRVYHYVRFHCSEVEHTQQLRVVEYDEETVPSPAEMYAVPSGVYVRCLHQCTRIDDACGSYEDRLCRYSRIYMWWLV